MHRSCLGDGTYKITSIHTFIDAGLEEKFVMRLSFLLCNTLYILDVYSEGEVWIRIF